MFDLFSLLIIFFFFILIFILNCIIKFSRFNRFSLFDNLILILIFGGRINFNGYIKILLIVF